MASACYSAIMSVSLAAGSTFEATPTFSFMSSMTLPRLSCHSEHEQADHHPVPTRTHLCPRIDCGVGEASLNAKNCGWVPCSAGILGPSPRLRSPCPTARSSAPLGSHPRQRCVLDQQRPSAHSLIRVAIVDEVEYGCPRVFAPWTAPDDVLLDADFAKLGLILWCNPRQHLTCLLVGLRPAPLKAPQRCSPGTPAPVSDMQRVDLEVRRPEHLQWLIEVPVHLAKRYSRVH